MISNNSNNINIQQKEVLNGQLILLRTIFNRLSGQPNKC